MREILTSDRLSWLAERQHGLGASDAPVIMGLSKYLTPFALYAEKLGLGAAVSENEAMEWGLLLEEPIAQKFQQETGRVVTLPIPWAIQVCEEPRAPWARATVDRWQQREPTQRAPLEIKTAAWSLGLEWTDEPPLAYQVQVQHQMLVTGASYASIAALIGGQRFLWCDVPRDDAFIDTLVQAEGAFWQRCLDHNPPPVDDSERTRAALKALYAKDSGEVISLGVEGIEIDNRLEAAKAAVAAAEAEKRLAENELLARIGHGTMAVLPNDVVYTYRETTRSEHLTKASTFRVLRRKAAKGTK